MSSTENRKMGENPSPTSRSRVSLIPMDEETLKLSSIQHTTGIKHSKGRRVMSRKGILMLLSLFLLGSIIASAAYIFSPGGPASPIIAQVETQQASPTPIFQSDGTVLVSQ